MVESSLKQRYIVKLVMNFMSGIINIVIVAVVPKALGPVAYGQFMYLQEFFNKTINFLDMGTSFAFFTKLSARRERKELIVFYFIYSLFILLFMFCFMAISHTLSIISSIVPDVPISYIYFGLFFGFFTWFTRFFIKISDAYALTVSVELIKIGHKILSLFLLLIFIYKLVFNLKLFYIYNYISLISFLLVLTWLFIKKDIFVNLFSIKYSLMNLTKEFMLYCHPLVTYNTIGLLSGLFDIWLLQKFAGSKQVGFYGLSYSLAAMSFLFTSAMIPIITREFSKSFAEKDTKHMRKLFYRYVPMLYGIAAYFSVFVSLQSENILMIFADDKFKEACQVLIVMAFYPLHQTYGQFNGSIFYATAQTSLYRNIGVVIMLLGAICTFVFIYVFDLKAEGLAYKMVLLQVINANVQLYFHSKLLKLDLKYFLVHQIYTVLCFFILAYISSYFISGFSSLVNFIISGFLYTILVTIVLYVYPQILAIKKEEINSLISRVKI